MRKELNVNGMTTHELFVLAVVVTQLLTDQGQEGERSPGAQEVAGRLPKQRVAFQEHQIQCNAMQTTTWSTTWKG